LSLNVFCLFSFIFLLTACSSKPYVVEPAPSESTELVTTVFIVSHGWHTGIVIPNKMIATRLPELSQRFNSAPFIEIGWGDKGFYQSEQITIGLALQAMFWSPGSVIHAVAVPDTPERYFSTSEVIALSITEAQTTSLTEFLANSFARDAQNNIIPSRPGIYGDSQFYEGEGYYYLLNTCNKWTAKALKSTGINLNTTFKLTAGSVMSALKKQSNVDIYTSKRSVYAGG